MKPPKNRSEQAKLRGEARVGMQRSSLAAQQVIVRFP